MNKKMGASFSSISRWLWTGKNKQEAALNKSSSSSSNEFRRLGVSKPVSVKIPSAASPKGTVMKSNSRDDAGIDEEYEVVLVPSVGDGISESEYGELDWSIGWWESFSPEFQSDDENDGSYAVLVPCYRPGCIDGRDGTNTAVGNVIKGVSCDYSAEGKKYMEQWLSSLQGR